MSTSTKIEWTQTTWNPATGCTRISAGCANCYAARMAVRLQAAGNPRYRNGFNVTLHHDLLPAPLAWRKPRLVFVNSMSDLFHEDIPFSFIQGVFKTMRKAHWHVFQVLTKRAEQLAAYAPLLDWPSNVWMGVTVESATHLDRIEELKRIPASVRFLSLEPLLSPIPDISLEGINWVIVGGESGPGARPMESAWVSGIRDMCQKACVPFFFKQWGGVNKKRTGRTLDGSLWSQMPKAADDQLHLIK